MTPQQLTDQQVAQLREWAAEGLDLNAMQKRINEELHLPMTYMETRFLLLDHDISLASAKPEPEAADGEPAPADAAPAPAGVTTVTVDEITPAHAIISGKVTFISGKRATWHFDKTGRIDWAPLDGEPSEEDLRGFEKELQQVLRNQMGGF